MKYRLHVIEAFRQSTEASVDILSKQFKGCGLSWITQRLLDLRLTSIDFGSISEYAYILQRSAAYQGLRCP